MEPADLGVALAAARLAAARHGKPLSFSKLERLVYDRLGTYAPSDEKLRVWHTPGGLDPEKADLLVIAALADVYGVTDLATLHPTLNERLPDVKALLSKIRCFWTAAA